MKTVPIQFRTDEENKREIETMAKSYDMTVSAYLRMLSKRDYRNYASQGLVPSVSQTAIQPTAETIAE